MSVMALSSSLPFQTHIVHLEGFGSWFGVYYNFPSLGLLSGWSLILEVAWEIQTAKHACVCWFSPRYASVESYFSSHVANF